MFRNTPNLPLLVIVLALCAASSLKAQEGCYFGVCPGDPGTEFPDFPQTPIPGPPSPAPLPESDQETSDKTPTPQPETPDQEAPVLTAKQIDQLCRTAFWPNGNFAWTPPMGGPNALAICEQALRRQPQDDELRLAYAMARDLRGDMTGAAEDDFYAVTEYRELAGEGDLVAAYALATMFDEDSGVSTPEASRLFSSVLAADTHPSLQCYAIRGLYGSVFGEFEDSEFSQLEELSRRSATCSALILEYYTGNWDENFETPHEQHILSAALNGYGKGMELLGILYAWGAPQLTGSSYTKLKDPERGGNWLLLSYVEMLGWRSKSAADSAWYPRLSGASAKAVQTALQTLGYYTGRVDGDIGPQTRAAVQRFVEAGIANDIFQQLREQEVLAPIMPPIGDVELGLSAVY